MPALRAAGARAARSGSRVASFPTFQGGGTWLPHPPTPNPNPTAPERGNAPADRASFPADRAGPLGHARLAARVPGPRRPASAPCSEPFTPTLATAPSRGRARSATPPSRALRGRPPRIGRDAFAPASVRRPTSLRRPGSTDIPPRERGRRCPPAHSLPHGGTESCLREPSASTAIGSGRRRVRLGAAWLSLAGRGSPPRQRLGRTPRGRPARPSGLGTPLHRRRPKPAPRRPGSPA